MGQSSQCLPQHQQQHAFGSKVDHIFDQEAMFKIQPPLEERTLVHRDAPLEPQIIFAVFLLGGALVRLKS
jgi:hypothetical protein